MSVYQNIEKCTRYIDADKLSETIKEHTYLLCDSINSRDYGMFLDGIMQAIDETPTADVQEVKHAKWIYCGHHEFHGHVFECSVCGRYLFANSKEDVYWEYPYCHCGAKMESVEGLEED